MIKFGEKISVVMITLNEEKSVSKVIKDIMQVDPRIEINIVDSSSDKTGEIAENLGAKVIYQFPPIGYGPAMDKALNSANREIVITLDCDDTYPVNQIDNFSKLIGENNYDVVDGNRLAKTKKYAIDKLHGELFFCINRKLFIFCKNKRSS